MDKEKGIGLQYVPKMRSEGRNYLLLIAIDDYYHVHKLNNCIRDAERLSAVLVKNYLFDIDRVEKIYNDNGTRDRILSSLHSYQNTIEPEDTLVIYFSGHGESYSNNGYWVPVDGEAKKYWTYIAFSDIKVALDNVNCFHICLIIDACFSGSFFLNHKNINPGNDQHRSRWGFSSSTDRQVALDGQPGGHSPFALSLMKHLDNNEYDISLHKLASDVIEDMRLVNQSPVCQPINVSGHELGQFVFHRRGQNTYVDPRDGKVYRTLEINENTWIAQNLDHDVGQNCYYLNDPNIGKSFGRLYDWWSAFKAIPPGWRLPTDEEIIDLISFLGGNAPAYYELVDGPIDQNWRALLGGMLEDDGYSDSGHSIPEFYGLGQDGYYWTQSESQDGKAWGLWLESYRKGGEFFGNSVLEEYNKCYRFSVRCIKC